MPRAGPPHPVRIIGYPPENVSGPETELRRCDVWLTEKQRNTAPLGESRLVGRRGVRSHPTGGGCVTAWDGSYGVRTGETRSYVRLRRARSKGGRQKSDAQPQPTQDQSWPPQRTPPWSERAHGPIWPLTWYLPCRVGGLPHRIAREPLQWIAVDAHHLTRVRDRIAVNDDGGLRLRHWMAINLAHVPPPLVGHRRWIEAAHEESPT